MLETWMPRALRHTAEAALRRPLVVLRATGLSYVHRAGEHSQRPRLCGKTVPDTGSRYRAAASRHSTNTRYNP